MNETKTRSHAARLRIRACAMLLLTLIGCGSGEESGLTAEVGSPGLIGLQGGSQGAAPPPFLPRGGTSGTATINDRCWADGIQGKDYLVLSTRKNLIPGLASPNANQSVYLRRFDPRTDDSVVDGTLLLSRSLQGGKANNQSDQASISPNGRFIAFRSFASDLVEGDTNQVPDIFLYDTQGTEPQSDDTIVRVSASTQDGAQADRPSLSPSVNSEGDVLFASLATNLVPNDNNRCQDIFIYYRKNRTLQRVSTADGSDEDANGPSYEPALSDDFYAAFVTEATNIAGLNGIRQVVVADLTEYGKYEVFSVNSKGELANGPCYEPSIDNSGSGVAWYSSATNLVDGDTNGFFDVFYREVQDGTRAPYGTFLVSKSRDGGPTNGHSGYPSVSDLNVAFASNATNICPDLNRNGLVDDDTNGTLDCFVNEKHGTNFTPTLVSRASTAPNGTGGEIGNHLSDTPSMAGESNVLFRSEATNLGGDTVTDDDIYLRDFDQTQYMSRSAFSFGTAYSVTVSSTPYSVVVGDFNKDGKPDLATACYANSVVAIRYNDGKGNFTGDSTDNVSVAGGPVCVVTGDLNGDGYLDLVTAGYSSSKVSVRLGTATPSNFTVVPDISAGLNPRSVTLGDFDRNGTLDIGVVGFGDGSETVLVNDGNAAFTKQVQPIAPLSSPYFTVAAPIQVGGSPPIMFVALETQNEILRSAGFTNSAYFGAQESEGMTGANPRSIAVAQLDPKRETIYNDLVSANFGDDTVTLQFGQPGGTGAGNFGSGIYNDGPQQVGVDDPKNTAPNARPTSVAVGDLDLNGTPDLVTANLGTSTCSALLGDGYGSFTWTYGPATGQAPISVVVLDVDGDGDLDIVTANNDEPTLSIIPNIQGQ